MIPRALLSEARPIGTGPHFTLPVSGPVAGPCQSSLGPRVGVHVEVFAANRVLLLPAGIGVRRPWTKLDGRITSAPCYGALVTHDPTGLVLVRPGARLTLADLFRSWGEPLSRTQLTSFSAPAGTQVAVFVDGRPWPAGRPRSRSPGMPRSSSKSGRMSRRTRPTRFRPAPDPPARRPSASARAVVEVGGGGCDLDQSVVLGGALASGGGTGLEMPAAGAHG